MDLIERIILFTGLLLIALLITVIVIRLRRLKLPYEAHKALFSTAERQFFLVLEQVIGGEVRIYAKVRIADIVQVRSGLSEKRFWAAFTPIASKHIDYVLCDQDSFAILAVIELDDSSHHQADRQQRDKFVNAVMAAAGIPLLRIPVQTRYDNDDLLTRLRTVL